MKQVIFAPDAMADLEGIGTYIASDNPSRAMSFIAELEDTARKIANAPEAYRAREDIAPGLRMAVKARYIILFRIKPDRVEIARVLHGARDLTRLKR
ncbi:MAG: type II toxin-antitoxin system RelE/ParE family toxin [Rhizomicrobium sp.]|nr:type II toxin-antitoxin system RelE/ParE family toxin [Rhizomicrobium sp.]